MVETGGLECLTACISEAMFDQQFRLARHKTQGLDIDVTIEVVLGLNHLLESDMVAGGTGCPLPTIDNLIGLEAAIGRAVIGLTQKAYADLKEDTAGCRISPALGATGVVGVNRTKDGRIGPRDDLSFEGDKISNIGRNLVEPCPKDGLAMDGEARN